MENLRLEGGSLLGGEARACVEGTVATGKRRHAGLVPRGKLQEMFDLKKEVSAAISAWRS